MDNEKLYESKKQDTLESKYQNAFLPKIHLYGKTATLLVLFISLLPPLYLSFVKGYHPGWEVILNGFIGGASIFGVFWIMEPVSFFLILGVSGTYLSFLSGNTFNMRIPAMVATQSILGVEAGSRKSEIASILAMVSSILVNIIILGLIILGGSAIIKAFPPAVSESFKYVLPGIYGSMFVSFSMRANKKDLIKVIPIGILILFAPINPFLRTSLAFVVGVIYSILIVRIDKK